MKTEQYIISKRENSILKKDGILEISWVHIKIEDMGDGKINFTYGIKEENTQDSRRLFIYGLEVNGMQFIQDLHPYGQNMIDFVTTDEGIKRLSLIITQRGKNEI